MSLKEQKAKLLTEAALAAGADLAQRAIDDLTLSADERAAREAARSRHRRKRLIVVVLGAAVAIVVAIALMNLIAQLWRYAIGLVLVAGLGVAGWLLLKPRLLAAQQKLLAARAEKNAAAAAAAAEKARAQAARQIEDELARLKSLRR